VASARSQKGRNITDRMQPEPSRSAATRQSVLSGPSTGAKLVSRYERRSAATQQNIITLSLSRRRVAPDGRAAVFCRPTRLRAGSGDQCQARLKGLREPLSAPPLAGIRCRSGAKNRPDGPRHLASSVNLCHRQLASPSRDPLRTSSSWKCKGPPARRAMVQAKTPVTGSFRRYHRARLRVRQLDLVCYAKGYSPPDL